MAGPFFTPTREAALDALAAFLPLAGRYGANRNQDPGPEADAYPTSRLSPYLRTRLLHEREVMEAVVKRYTFGTVEKFIQEVLWRTYWKGWLEMRPGVWERYREGLHRWKVDGLPEDAKRAREGRTGIACFDAWVHELVDYGYLHNHTRMWFASIWIFTLRLPWELGATFFAEYLLDGDPASNLLSWRWVGGLQTPGKHYLARADNIAKYTEGRFNPIGELVEDTPPLEGAPHPPRKALEFQTADREPRPDAGCGLLLHPEDLQPETGEQGFESVAWGWNDKVAEEEPVGEAVVRFRSRAMADTAARVARANRTDPIELDAARWEDAVLDWVREMQLREVWVARVPVGPWRPGFERVGKRLEGEGIVVREITCGWDQTFFPHATAGFFRFRKESEAFPGMSLSNAGLPADTQGAEAPTPYPRLRLE